MQNHNIPSRLEESGNIQKLNIYANQERIEEVENTLTKTSERDYESTLMKNLSSDEKLAIWNSNNFDKRPIKSQELKHNLIKSGSYGDELEMTSEDSFEKDFNSKLEALGQEHEQFLASYPTSKDPAIFTLSMGPDSNTSSHNLEYNLKKNYLLNNNDDESSSDEEDNKLKEITEEVDNLDYEDTIQHSEKMNDAFNRISVNLEQSNANKIKHVEEYKNYEDNSEKFSKGSYNSQENEKSIINHDSENEKDENVYSDNEKNQNIEVKVMSAEKMIENLGDDDISNSSEDNGMFLLKNLLKCVRNLKNHFWGFFIDLFDNIFLCLELFFYMQQQIFKQNMIVKITRILQRLLIQKC